MKLQLLSRAEQVAAHLRAELRRGRWRHVMPGILKLGRELGVNPNTLQSSLDLLEEGLIENQGHGRPRRVVMPHDAHPASLRIKILLYDRKDHGLPDNVELISRLQEAGHAADFAARSLQDMGMCQHNVERFVSKYPADAWIVKAGSREVLEWFADQPVPVFAMFGRFSGLPIAGTSPRKTPAMTAAVQRLVSLGHRRIVMLTREERRKPKPALFEQNFLDELNRLGLPTGDFNLPDWEESADGLREGLDSLFQHTPPTALIIDEVELLQAVHQFLAFHQIRIPQHMSLLCTDVDPAFDWCRPTISHVYWDFHPLVRYAIQWAGNIATGKKNIRQKLFDAKLVEGGTMAPVA